MAFSIIDVRSISTVFNDIVEVYEQDKTADAIQSIFEEYGSGAVGFDGD